jgi:hypothetical protein
MELNVNHADKRCHTIQSRFFCGMFPVNYQWRVNASEERETIGEKTANKIGGGGGT